MRKILFYPRIMAVLLVAFISLAGCKTTQEQLLDSGESQVKLRSVQSRAFDTIKTETTLRTVIATLQDLKFVIDKADFTLGMVTGTQLDTYALRMTVTVRPRGKTQTIVRANAQYHLEPVVEPLPYQRFFTSLEKAMFLTAQKVD